jgi:hypothetical protein
MTTKNLSIRGKPCPRAALSTTNPTRTGLVSSPCFRCESPATYRPSHGTAFKTFMSKTSERRRMCHTSKFMECGKPHSVVSMAGKPVENGTGYIHGVANLRSYFRVGKDDVCCKPSPSQVGTAVTRFNSLLATSPTCGFSYFPPSVYTNPNKVY